jgi:hypothetical protein
MIRLRGMVVVGVAIVGVASPAAAQTTLDTIPLVLSTPVSVRFAGLNGAGAALVGNAANVFSNPAGLATIRHIALEGAYQTAPDRGFIGSAAIAWRLRQFDLGFGARYHDLGDAPSAPGDPTSQSLGVGSAVYRFGIIALGASAKMVRQREGAVTETGVGGDLGAVIAIFDIMAFGFAMQNVGGNWDKNSTIAMPRLTRFGFTMNYVDPQGNFRLLSTLEWQWPAQQASRFILGGEAGVVLGQFGIVGRVAYGSRPKTNLSLPPVTYGVTVELRWILFDYSYQFSDRTDLATQRVGARMAF